MPLMQQQSHVSDLRCNSRETPLSWVLLWPAKLALSLELSTSFSSLPITGSKRRNSWERPPALRVGLVSRLLSKETGSWLVHLVTALAGLDAGSAFVFEKVNGSWVEKTTLQVSSQLAGDQFGFSVAMHGDLIAVSAPWSSNIVNGDGAVFLFQNTGSGWNQLTKIQSSTPMPHQIFGRALDMDANTLVVGSPSANSSAVFSGMVTVFGMEYGSWTELVDLLPGPDSSHHRFGFSVSLEEDMIAVGAPFAGDGPFPRGEVVLFSRTGRSWIELGAVTSPDYTPYEGVGMSTMLSDGQLLIGSPLTSGWTVGLGRAMLWNLSDLPEVGTYCEGSGCPCGNEDPDAGCYNSTSLGARLWAEGSLATSHPNPRLFADQLPPGKMAMLWMGEPGPGTVFGDGLLCMGGEWKPRVDPSTPLPAAGHGSARSSRL